jgi:hypothetical protein
LSRSKRLSVHVAAMTNPKRMSVAPAIGQPAEHVAVVVSTNRATDTVKVTRPHRRARTLGTAMIPIVGHFYDGTLVYLGALRPAS